MREVPGRRPDGAEVGVPSCVHEWEADGSPSLSPAALELVAAATEQAEPSPGRRLRAAVPSGVSEKTSLLWPQTKLLPSIRPTYFPTNITEQSHILQAGFLWQTMALSTSPALVFVGADRKEKWRRVPTNQLPACSKSHERVPRAEGNLAFKSQGNTVPRSSRRRDLARYLHRGPVRPGK